MRTKSPSWKSPLASITPINLRLLLLLFLFLPASLSHIELIPEYIVTFDEAFDVLLKHEGGYSDHLYDPGGRTRFGITEHVARQHGYVGDMRALPIGLAKRIYRVAYWDAVKADEMPDPLRYPLFDAAVNSGPNKAVQWLQRALNIADDGVLGPVTLEAVKLADPERTMRAMVGQRMQFMASLSTWQHFGKGWARRIASILQEV